jgi:hypothetical protein
VDVQQSAFQAHLIQLAREYADLVSLSEDPALDSEDRRTVFADRSVTHDQIIALFEQLGIPFVDRDDVRSQALAIAQSGTVRRY